MDLTGRLVPPAVHDKLSPETWTSKGWSDKTGNHIYCLVLGHVMVPMFFWGGKYRQGKPGATCRPD